MRKSLPSRARASRTARSPASRRTVILDSDGVVKYLRGDHRVGAMLDSEILQAGSRLVVPSVVLVEAARASLSQSLLEDLTREVHELAPVDVERAQQAAALLDYGLKELHREVGIVDALVVAEAFRSIPAIIVTSDPSDMRLLCDSEPSASGRVAIWRT